MLAVGLGAACELTQNLALMARIHTLRDCFRNALQERFGDRIVLNGNLEERLPNTLNVSFVEMIGADSEGG